MYKVQFYIVVDYNKILILIVTEDIIPEVKAEVKLETKDSYLFLWKFPNIVDSGSKYIKKKFRPTPMDKARKIWIHSNVIEIVELNSQGKVDPILFVYRIWSHFKKRAKAGNGES